MKMMLDLQLILYPNPRHLSGDDPLRHGAYARLLRTIMPSFLQALLRASGGNKAHAARLAGFNRSTLERKLTLYRLVLQKQLVQQPSAEVKP